MVDPIDPIQSTTLPATPPIAPIDFRADSIKSFSQTTPQHSFEPATKKRPTIAFPSSMFAVGNFLESASEVQSILVRIVEQRNLTLEEAYQKAFEENTELLKKSVEASKSRDWWDFLRKVAVCLLGGASVIIGASTLITTAGPAAYITGGAMLLSGISSLLGNSLHEAGIKPEIATILTAIGSASALLSGCLGYYFTVPMQTTFTKLATTALNIFLNSTEMAGTIRKMDYSAFQERLAETKIVLDRLDCSMHILDDTLELSAKMYRNLSQKITRAARDWTLSLRRVTESRV